MAKIGLRYATIGPSISPVWPPTGLPVAALVLLGPSYWPAILLGAFSGECNDQHSVLWMQVSPHAFPVVQTLQHFGPDELPHAAVRDGPLVAAAASVSASAPARRTLFQTNVPCARDPPFTMPAPRL